VRRSVVREPTVLQRRDLVPHFQARTTRGDEFSYRTIWQRLNLVLVILLEDADQPAYAGHLASHEAAFAEHDSVCVVTHDRVAGIPVPGAAVADRWGEIVHVTAGLPTLSDLLEWLDYVAHRCPECEGEVR
jgi:hypothetical protein